MSKTKSENLSFVTRSFGRATVAINNYRKGGGLAVGLIDEDNEPLAVLSVNIPESAHLLGKNEFFAKTWSENEELAEDALASGIFSATGRTSGGLLNAGIWRLN